MRGSKVRDGDTLHPLSHLGLHAHSGMARLNVDMTIYFTIRCFWVVGKDPRSKLNIILTP